MVFKSKVDFCARLEYTSYGSNKFWQLKFIENDKYMVSWGKIGYPNQGSHHITESEARKKAKEKLKKGYQVVKSDLDLYHKKIDIAHQNEALLVEVPKAKEKKINQFKI